MTCLERLRDGVSEAQTAYEAAEKRLNDAARLLLIELYPNVVDGREEEGGVPSRLIEDRDAGKPAKESTPWVMLRGLRTRTVMTRTRTVRMAGSGWTSWRVRALGG